MELIQSATVPLATFTECQQQGPPEAAAEDGSNEGEVQQSKKLPATISPITLGPSNDA
jgi:hypothetical protein